MTIPKTMANAGASAISLEFGITGPAFTISTACSSSAHAIGLAFQMVRSGMCRCGHRRRERSAVQLRNSQSVGSDARGFADGLPAVFEGPQRHDAGRRRGDDGDRIARSRAGAGREAARRDRGLRHVERRASHHAAVRRRRGEGHANGGERRRHRAGADRLRQRARHRDDRQTMPRKRPRYSWRFGDHAKRLAISSTKSMHGHTLGAAGAIEAAAAILALANGILPPTIHYSERDPECDLDYIPNCRAAPRCEYAMSNSFAFGGLNAVLVLRRA